MILTRTPAIAAALACSQGGPITAPITLPSGPQSTIVDPAGGPVKTSVSYMSSHLASNVLPLANSWASAPDPTRATAAIVAIEKVLPEIIGFANELPDGNTIPDCAGMGSSSRMIQDTTKTLLQKIQNVYCEISRILAGLETGQQTTEPNDLSLIVQGIRNDADKVSLNLLVAMSQLGTAIPPATQTTTVGNIPKPHPPVELMSTASTNIILPPGEGKDPGKEEEPTKTDNDPEPSSTVQSISPCTTTVSATYESVFCSVTVNAGSGQNEGNRGRQEPTGCSTLAYNPGTACNTLSASTATLLLSEETLCSPDNCGASSCARGKRSLQQVKKRAAPARDKVALACAQEANHIELGFPGNKAFSTSNWVEFGNHVNTLAVSSLYGCTSVVVVSTQGAWASHFWEWPSFTHGDNQFEYDVIRRLHTGVVGHMFDDANQPRVFVVAPRQKEYLRNGDPSNSETAGGSVFRHNGYVKRILAELRTMFPNNNELTLSTIQYSIQEKWESERVRGEDGQDKMVPDRGDSLFNFHRGKLLIRYQPAPKKCAGNTDIVEAEQPKPMWRMWFEANDIGDRRAEWVPAEHQHLKRDEQSCPVKGADPGSVYSTSASLPATSAPTDIASSTTVTITTPTEPPPPPPPVPKTCNLHLDEYVIDPEHEPIFVAYRLYDGTTSRNTWAISKGTGTKSTLYPHPRLDSPTKSP
ncbi:hypothetical protein PG988_013320 [Apiospora saccharicola]